MGISIFPGTGRWQREALTEGAFGPARPRGRGGRAIATSTTRYAGGPPPRSGEDLSL
jgi:hypothetical protein